MKFVFMMFVAFVFAGCQSRAAASAEPAPTPTVASATKSADTTVLVYANLGEADEECGCGDIIRAVRAAAAKGVKTREVDTRDKAKKAEASKQYKILVSPAVLFLDASDKEIRRFEGESNESVKALKAALDDLTKR